LEANCYGDSDGEPGPDEHHHARSDVDTPIQSDTDQLSRCRTTTVV
jgi:hypothetical protein